MRTTSNGEGEKNATGYRDRLARRGKREIQFSSFLSLWTHDSCCGPMAWSSAWWLHNYSSIIKRHNIALWMESAVAVQLSAAPKRSFRNGKLVFSATTLSFNPSVLLLFPAARPLSDNLLSLLHHQVQNLLQCSSSSSPSHPRLFFYVPPP